MKLPASLDGAIHLRAGLRTPGGEVGERDVYCLGCGVWLGGLIGDQREMSALAFIEILDHLLDCRRTEGSMSRFS